MASIAVTMDLQPVVKQYTIFCELWPLHDVRGGERQRVGVEVELIGSHTTENTHIDPACPKCIRLRSLLLVVAQSLVAEITSNSRSITYHIDSHTNSILCLPASGNRSFVSVSLNVFWSDKGCSRLEEGVLNKIKASLNTLGIRQR